jgi:hypothetical protein
MTAAIAIRQARAAGVLLRVEGDDLLLEAAAQPAPAVLEMLSRGKPAIVLWLRPGADGWSAEDWHSYFDERATIANFDGGPQGPGTEVSAFSCCVSEWLNRNPVRSPPDLCLGCSAVGRPHDPLLPFGVESQGLAWLHHQCWRVWQENRRGQAVVALAKMGIEEPGKPAGRQP